MPSGRPPVANQSAIEWTDATWNFLKGCTPVSAGCLNCYAAAVAHQKQSHPNPKVSRQFSGLTVLKPAARGERAVFNGRINVVEHLLDVPLRWREPRRIFVNSLSDLFHEDVPTEIIDRAFAVMALCPQHTFQILTKRPARMAEYLADPKRPVHVGLAAFGLCLDNPGRRWGKGIELTGEGDEVRRLKVWPLPNVWIGTSVEDQAAADKRIPLLLGAPAAVRFLSCEPLLGEVDLEALDCWPRYDHRPSYAFYRVAFGGGDKPIKLRDGIDWVIAGGESGPHARPMHPDWARSLRDQCLAAGVPFHFKQWGEHIAESLTDLDVSHGNCLTRDGRRFSYSASLGPPPGGGRWVLWPSSACWVRVDDPPTGAVMVRRVGKKAAGRELDGRTWDESPPTAAEALASHA
jgi:protein gp37